MEERHEPTVEVLVDALDEGDVPIQVSTARGALGSRDFRIVWFGIMASNVGTWMQQVTLGAFAYDLSRSPTFVSLIAAAQLGPILVLSLVGGVLSDTFDRRKLIVVAQAWQLLACCALAAVVAQDEPSRTNIVLAVLAIGIGNAMNAPALAALLPTLVERHHLPGAISLNSAQMNGARVVGPAIGGLLYPAIGAPPVFLINAGTYLFAIGSMLMIKAPPVEPVRGSSGGLRRIAEGFGVARRTPIIRRVLITVSAFSFLCLPFLGQFPTIAADNLGIRVKSLSYGLLYASFGTGAVVGALSIGTFLSRQDLRRVAQLGLATFSIVLLTFALLSDLAPAYPVAAMLGFAYFATVTSLSTVLQMEVQDEYRGRVLSLWQMGFAGTVPLGLLAAGPIAEATSIRLVLLYGAVAGVALTWYMRGGQRSRAGTT